MKDDGIGLLAVVLLSALVVGVVTALLVLSVLGHALSA